MWFSIGSFRLWR